MWHLYILSCSDGTYYTGITTDLAKRVASHNRGKGAAYTKNRRPVELVYSKDVETKSLALRLELKIKRLSVENKLRLIKYNFNGRFPSAENDPSADASGLTQHIK